MTLKLTDAFLRGIKATGKAQKHPDGGGLYIYVSPAGGKLWRMDYRFEGKRKTLSFGAYPAASLKEARKRQEGAKEQMAAGVAAYIKKPPKLLSGRKRKTLSRLLPASGLTNTRTPGLTTTEARYLHGSKMTSSLLSAVRKSLPLPLRNC